MVHSIEGCRWFLNNKNNKRNNNSRNKNNKSTVVILHIAPERLADEITNMLKGMDSLYWLCFPSPQLVQTLGP